MSLLVVGPEKRPGLYISWHSTGGGSVCLFDRLLIFVCCDTVLAGEYVV